MVDYDLLTEQAEAFCEDTPDEVAAMANLSSLIYYTLDRLNWAGFYRVKGEELILGPFQGKVACIRIAKGRGVCGTAWKENRVLVVPDVHAFPGHIACDGDSQSEIVVPIHRGGEVIGVLDIDSPVLNRFDDADREGLTALVQCFERYL
ncbi:MAG: GAF domain-containing protein [Lachnospiraceae bacterium]|nr:GAF domain-containing protein [Lachnospiraceae bacterium]